MLNGTDAPNLRNIAVKVLSQTVAASSCEWNWSTFNLIHTKRRNRLGTARLNDLVFVYYNMRLRIKHTKEGEEKDYMDPIDLAYIYNEDEEDDLYFSSCKKIENQF